MAKNGKETALAKIEEYAIFKLGDDVSKLPDIIAANVGAAGLSTWELPRITVPTGGATQWQVEDLSGETTAVEELVGVPILLRDQRSYWKEEFGGSGTPPDCASQDLQIGYGDPGGSCVTCPFAQFWSDPKGGKGQACKQSRALFLVQRDEILPTVISAPPTSLRPVKEFFLRMASRAMPHWGVIIGLKLNRVDAGSIKYGTISCRVVQTLDEKTREMMKRIKDGLEPQLRRVEMRPVENGEAS